MAVTFYECEFMSVIKLNLMVFVKDQFYFDAVSFLICGAATYLKSVLFTSVH